MATDATGTPTSPDGIPTYNTAGDPPSGKGFNAAMAVIQTGLSARVPTPAGIATGEVPVWNGSTWVRSSALASVVNPAPGFGAAYAFAVANADLNPVPTSWIHYLNATVANTTVRSLTPGVAGQRIVLRNSNQPTTLLHLTGGGISGGQFYLRTTANTTLQAGDTVEFVYDGSEWLEVARDKVTPSAKVLGTTGLSVPNSTITDITLSGATQWSQGGMAVASGGITVPENGIYVARVCAVWVANALGSRQFYIAAGGGTFAFQQIAPSVDASNAPYQILIGVGSASAGSVLKPSVWQNSGGTLTLDAGSQTYMGFDVTRIG